MLQIHVKTNCICKNICMVNKLPLPFYSFCFKNVGFLRGCRWQKVCVSASWGHTRLTCQQRWRNAERPLADISPSVRVSCPACHLSLNLLRGGAGSARCEPCHGNAALYACCCSAPVGVTAAWHRCPVVPIQHRTSWGSLQPSCPLRVGGGVGVGAGTTGMV